VTNEAKLRRSRRPPTIRAKIVTIVSFKEVIASIGTAKPQQTKTIVKGIAVAMILQGNESLDNLPAQRKGGGSFSQYFVDTQSPTALKTMSPASANHGNSVDEVAIVQ